MNIVCERFHSSRELCRVRDKVPLCIALLHRPAIIDNNILIACLFITILHKGICNILHASRLIPHAYCFTSSTLRFRALPSSVSFVATGHVGPSPQLYNLAAFTEYCVTRALTTAIALSIESFIFVSIFPTLSV